MGKDISPDISFDDVEEEQEPSDKKVTTNTPSIGTGTNNKAPTKSNRKRKPVAKSVAVCPFE